MNKEVQAIRAEIVRRKEEYKEDRYMSDYRGQIAYYKDEIYDDLLSFIDSKPDEKPSKDLEEAATTFATDTLPFGEGTYVDGGAYRGFIAGAEWQAKQMPMPEDTVIFQKGVAEGKRLMLEDAIESEAEEFYNDGEIHCVVGVGKYFKPGDEVYVIKKEEK